MTKVTYKPKHSGDPSETEWDGRVFKAGETVEYDGREKAHKDFIERAKLNPWFDVDGESAPQKGVNGKPETPEEYRAYALEWIKNAKSSRELDGRWKSEAKMREDLGWGSDDQALIDPIFGPKSENLKRAEDN